jgi:hypothetical protein
MTKKAKLGVSQAQYARTRRVTAPAISKHIKSGLLADALHSDGSIDADVADKLLAKGLAKRKGNVAAPNLATARRMKLAAQVALLLDQIEAKRDAYVTANPIAAVVRAHSLAVMPHLEHILTAAENAAGRPVTEAQTILREGVFTTLDALVDTYSAARAKASVSVSSAPPLDLSTMGETELAARKAETEAQLLQYQRAELRGEAVAIADVAAAFSRRIADTKQGFLSIPTSAAPEVSIATPAEARALVRSRLIGAVANLEGPGVTARELAEAVPS